MRKVLLLVLFACLLPSCRSGKAVVAGRAAASLAEGEMRFAEGRYDAAAIAFTQALEAAGQLGDQPLLARCYYALGETCNHAYFYEEGLACADSARNLSLRNGDPALADSALYQQAISHIGLEEYLVADQIFDALLNKAPLPSGLAACAKAGKAFVAVEYEKDPTKALPLFEEALSIGDGLDNFEYWSAYAYCLAASGRPDKAAAVFGDLEEAGYSETFAYQAWQGRTLALQGDWPAAFRGLERAADRQRSATSRIIRQASFKAQRDYLALENQQAQARERSRTIIAVLAISLLSLLLMIVVLLYRAKDRKNRTERTQLLDWASSIESQRRDLTLSQAKLRADYARIYQSYFQQIGRISEIVENAPEKEKGMSFQLSRLIKDIRLDKKGQNQFETMINRDLEDIMLHFREDFPNYYDDSYRFISYVFAGFDATTIRLLTGMASDGAVHTKKSTIKKAILSSDSPHKDYYLLFL